MELDILVAGFVVEIMRPRERIPDGERGSVEAGCLALVCRRFTPISSLIWINWEVL